MSDKISSLAELRELIHLALRTQNPEWVEPNGHSPICDSYEARFAELFSLTDSRTDDDLTQQHDLQCEKTYATT
jgi:hypothetical protein